MPLLNFQPRFAPLVERGEKRQTIRPPRKWPLQEGEVLHLYTGLRTSRARKLGTGRVTQVADVAITLDGMVWLSSRAVVRGRHLDHIAHLDGFADHYELLTWLLETHGLPFAGTLIRWELML